MRTDGEQVGLRQSAMIPSDLRAYAQALLTTLPAQLLLPYLHPVFHSLHDMPKEVRPPLCPGPTNALNQCGTIGEFGVILPMPLPLSSERLERHGLYLIEDGQNIFLWVGRDAVPQLVMDVFEIPSYTELRGGKVRTPSSPFSSYGADKGGRKANVTSVGESVLPADQRHHW